MSLAAPESSAGVINFNGRAHGEVVTDYYQREKGVTISAANFQGGPNLAIAFDTNKQGTNDADLEFNWDKGNLTGTLLNKVLILAENDLDANADGRIDRPDDQGSQPHLGTSGQITFEFDALYQSLGIDLIDVEAGDFNVRRPTLAPAVAGDELGFIAFHLQGLEMARVSLGAFVDPNSAFYDPTVVYGDNSANRIQPMTAEALNIVAYDKLVIDMGLCLAIDNLVFEPFDGAAPNTPEPSGLALVGLGVAALARRTRRK